MTKIERQKRAFINLAKRGKTYEKAWDRAVEAGDLAKQAELTKKSDAYYRAWEKYEALGFTLVGSTYHGDSLRRVGKSRVVISAIYAGCGRCKTN